MRQPLILMFVALSGAAFAQNAGDVPLPRERPVTTSSAPMPVEMPSAIAASSAPSSASELEAPSSLEPPSSAEPVSSEASSSAPPPPPEIHQTACPAVLSGEVTAKTLPPIHDGQCGTTSPLSLEAISANGRPIPLTAPIVTDCGMATALPGWLSAVDTYADVHEHTRIKAIDLGNGYECRNVDNLPTGGLSDHSFADATDLMGFTLEDGRKISIAPGFNGTQAQGHDILHFARDAACTAFTTVLSPDADGFHQNNMHLDLDCHGKACTIRLCQ